MNAPQDAKARIAKAFEALAAIPSRFPARDAAEQRAHQALLALNRPVTHGDIFKALQAERLRPWKTLDWFVRRGWLVWDRNSNLFNVK